jgi:hypothetical protein
MHGIAPDGLSSPGRWDPFRFAKKPFAAPGEDQDSSVTGYAAAEDLRPTAERDARGTT